MNYERSFWKYPICNIVAQIENLEVDQYICGILTHVNNEFDICSLNLTATICGAHAIFLFHESQLPSKLMGS